MISKTKSVLLFGAALAGMVVSSASADAATTNYDKYAKKGYTKIIKLTDTDITSQLDSALREAAKLDKTMIYIPSGNRTVSDYNALIPSNVAIVAEADTTVTKSSGSMVMLRTKAAAKNSTIYGGTYNGNEKAKNVIELTNTDSFRIQNVTMTEGANVGLRLQTTTNLALNTVNIVDNGGHGLFADNNTSVRVNVVNADSNGANGYYIKGDGVDNSVAIRGQKLSAKDNDESGLMFTAGAHAQAYKAVYSDNGVLASEQAVVNLKGSTSTLNDEAGVMVENSRFYANVYTNKFTNNDHQGISAVKSNKIYVKNAVVTGNGREPEVDKNGSNGHGIGVTEGAYGSIASTNLSNNTDTGVSVFGDGSKVVMSKNTLNENGRHGVGARQNVTISLKSNAIKTNGYNGVLMSDSTKASAFSGNTIAYNKQNGVTVEASQVSAYNKTRLYKNGTNITVSKGSNVSMGSGNQFQKSKDQGINVDQSTIKISGTGNVVSDSKYNDILLDNKSKLTVYKNGLTVSGSGESGMIIKNSTAKLSSGSTFKDNGKYGIGVYNGGSLTESGTNFQGNRDQNIYWGQ